MSARLLPPRATTQQELLRLGASYDQHPLIESELQSTAPAFPDRLGAGLEKRNSTKNHTETRLHPVERTNIYRREHGQAPRTRSPYLASKDQYDSRVNASLAAELA